MKARKMGSKLMAMLMALVMVLGLSVTAVAAEAVELATESVAAEETTTIDTTKTGSLTLYKYDYTAADANTTDTLTQYKGTGEEDTQAETTYSGYAIAGVTFDVLKVADIQLYTAGTGTSTSTEVVYSLDEDLAEILGLKTASAVTINSVYYWTSTQISEALAEKLEADEADYVTTTTDKLKTFISTVGNGSVSQMTDEKGKASWSGLKVGLYLVVETSVPDQVNTTTDPFFVSIPMTTSDGTEWNYDVVAYPKNQTDFPDITKKVRETSNSTGAYTDTVSTSIGDSLDYRIVSKLPAITSTATYLTEYTFVDTLSAGQTYNKDIVVSFYSSITDRTAASLGNAPVTLTVDTDYTVVTSEDADKNTVITISLTKTGLEKVNEAAAALTNTNGNYSIIVISYTATLNENAVLGDSGNENDVKLTYARTSTSYTETIEDKTEVYTFGLDMSKKFSGGSVSDASEVEFTLTNSDGEYIVAKADVTGVTGAYTVSGLDSSTTAANNTVFSPAADGSLYISGLEAGTYTLTEIETVSGYNLLNHSITIVISSKAETITASTVDYTSSGIGNTVTDKLKVVETVTTKTTATVNDVEASMSADGTVSASTNAAVVIEITNTKGFTLPLTGGEGVWILTILGVLIIGLGAYSLVLRKVKRA